MNTKEQDIVTIPLGRYGSLYTVRANIVSQKNCPGFCIDLLVDTGCEITCIDRRVLEAYSLDINVLCKRPLRTGGGRILEDIVRIQSISLRDKIFWESPSVGTDERSFDSTCKSEDDENILVAGILGMDFLSHFEFTFKESGYLELRKIKDFTGTSTVYKIHKEHALDLEETHTKLNKSLQINSF